MPTIPTYSAKATIPGAVNFGQVAPDAMAAPGRALQRTGDTALALYVDYEETKRRARSAIETMQANTNATKDLNDLTLATEQAGDWRNGEAQFQERALAIRQKHAAGIGDEMARKQFEGNFAQAADSRRVSISRKLAGDMQNEAEASLLLNLDEQSRAAASAPNDLAAQASRQAAAKAISDASNARLIDPTKAVALYRKFNSDVDEAKARTLMTADPEAALALLNDGKQLQGLSPERRAILADTATRRVDTMERARITAEDRAQRKAERAVRLTQVTNEASLIARIQADNAPSDVELADMVARQQISDEGFRMLRNERVRLEQGTDNPRVMVDLQTSLSRDGRDIHEDILQARDNGQISAKSAAELMKENQRQIEGRGKEDWRDAEQKRQFDFMSRYLGADKLPFSFDDDTAQRLALAQREYRERVIGGKEAPQDVANDIVARYSQNVRAAPSGYYTEPKTGEDVIAAGKRLQELRNGKLLSPEAYRREMDALRAKSEVLPPAEPAKPAKKK